MKVIVPAAGRGQRFKDAGYKEHKPLIPVTDEMNIIDYVLKPLLAVFNPDDIYVVVRDDDFELYKYLLQNYPLTHRIKVGPHAGAAEAVKVALYKMGPELTKPVECDDLFIINSDQFIQLSDIKRFVGHCLLANVKTATQVFYSPGTDDKWSFVAPVAGFETSNYFFPVHKVAEKKRISNWANTGFYYFMRSQYFLDSLAYQSPAPNGEYYVAPVLLYPEDPTPDCLAVMCNEDFYGLGTPEDLEEFKKGLDF